MISFTPFAPCLPDAEALGVQAKAVEGERIESDRGPMAGDRDRRAATLDAFRLTWING